MTSGTTVIDLGTGSRGPWTGSSGPRTGSRGPVGIYRREGIGYCTVLLGIPHLPYPGCTDPPHGRPEPAAAVTCRTVVTPLTLRVAELSLTVNLTFRHAASALSALSCQNVEQEALASSLISEL